MNKSISPERVEKERYLVKVIAPAIMLLTPFIGFVRYHDYPLWRPEILVSVALLLGLGVVAGWLMARFAAAPRSLVSAFILSLAIDLQFAGFAWMKDVLALGGDEVLLVPAVMMLVGVSLILHRHLDMIIVVTLGVVLFSTILLPVETIPVGETYKRHVEPRTDLPLVLHLVLDGQIGIEGLPIDIQGAVELGVTQKEFYKKFGFALFGAAFSHSADTQISLSQLVNGTEAQNAVALVGGGSVNHRFRVYDNAWFKKLSDMGYRIRVYQSDYIDFCKAKDADVDYCFTYPANSIRSLADANIGLRDKLWVMFDRFLSRSIAYREGVMLVRSWKANPSKAFSDQEKWLGSLSSLPIFDRIAADMLAAPRGTAFFAHLMLPHSSYVFDHDCRVRNDSSTWLVHYDPASVPFANTPSGRQERYHLYLDQDRCTQRALSRLFLNMKSMGLFKEATVIVHGDHGSRIYLNYPLVGNKEMLADADLRDGYSALFAVKAPRLAAGYYREKRSIQSLFAGIVLGGSVLYENDSVFMRGGQMSVPMRW